MNMLGVPVATCRDLRRKRTSSVVGS
jgi:hypothetical protein